MKIFQKRKIEYVIVKRQNVSNYTVIALLLGSSVGQNVSAYHVPIMNAHCPNVMQLFYRFSIEIHLRSTQKLKQIKKSCLALPIRKSKGSFLRKHSKLLCSKLLRLWDVIAGNQTVLKNIVCVFSLV